jgi:hypothetical protein
VDIPALLSLAAEAPPLTCSHPPPSPSPTAGRWSRWRGTRLLLLLRENLALLQQLARSCAFSPL